MINSMVYENNRNLKMNIKLIIQMIFKIVEIVKMRFKMKIYTNLQLFKYIKYMSHLIILFKNNILNNHN